MKVVIFAGGSGTRLWPVSRQLVPKQVQLFGDNLTLLQKTYARLRRGWPTGDIFVSTSVQQYGMVRRQFPALPKSQYILEPERRENGPAVGLAATVLHYRNPREIMATIWSDAYVREEEDYVRALKAAGQVVAQHPQQTVLVGIKPRFADTGLGYIKMKKHIGQLQSFDIFAVERFVEKPNAATANRYLRSWQYLWDPGIAVFRVDAMLDKFRQWLAPSYRTLQAIERRLGTRSATKVIRRLYPRMQKITIDYGILEHDQAMLVIPTELTWSDIGNWGAVYDMLATHPRANVFLQGHHLTIDSAGNLLFSYSGKLIAAAGIQNMIVIETQDALLVSSRHRAQDVKKIVTALQRRRWKRYL